MNNNAVGTVSLAISILLLEAKSGRGCVSCACISRRLRLQPLVGRVQHPMFTLCILQYTLIPKSDGSSQRSAV